MARWVIEDVDPKRVSFFSRRLGIPPLAVEILLRRGFDDEESMERFINPSKDLVHDPFLLKDMERAVDILIDAWKRKEKVLIHGDYDVDGTTGAALLYTFMKRRGWNVEVYIPDRMNEGYGVSPNAIRDFHSKGGDIILTVDCGITALDSIKLAKDLGLKVVLTDHHEVLETLPPADAVINPRRPDDEYPFKGLAGVGVAFKLVQALADRFGMELEDLEEYLDLVTLGTVADMVPLLDENRFYVKKGLKIIGKVRKRPGLRILLEKLMISEIRSRDISYKIAPRLNAAGRMGSAIDAFKLLVTEDEKEAESVVGTLMNHNVLRQTIEASIFNEAVKNIEKEELYRLPVIVVGGENWHLGVIGIVASRIANKYGKPTLVVSFIDGIGKGSARSVNGTNILEVFQELSEDFEEFGGHTMAVGFTISRENFERLKEDVKNLDIERAEEVIKVDAEISVRDVNPELFEVLDLLEPFGLGNPEPVFLIRDLEIIKSSFFDGGKSASLVLKGGRRTIGAVWNSLEEDDAVMIRQGAARMDVLGSVEPDFFNPKLRIRDTRFKSGIDEIDVLLSPPSKRYDSKDREMEILEKRLKEILWDDPWGKAIFCDIRVRNAVIMKLIEEEAIVVSINPIISRHTKMSLTRHGDFPDVFTSVKEYLERRPDAERIILNEVQLFHIFSDHELVRRFISEVKGKKLFAIGTRFTPSVRSFLKSLGFKRLRRSKVRKFSLKIQDMRKEEYSPSSEKVSFILESVNVNGFEAQVYDHSMNRFQRISITKLIKRGKVSKLIAPPNTDGLPALLGGEVVFRASPKTPYEILDAVFPVLENSISVLTLNYGTQIPELEDPLDVEYFNRFTRRFYESGPKELIRILEDPEEII